MRMSNHAPRSACGQCILILAAAALFAAGCSKAEPVATKEPTMEPVAAAAVAPSVPTKAAPGEAEYLVVQIEGMTCGGCAWEIKDKLTKIDGVRSVNVNLAGECAAIGYDATKVQKKALLTAFVELAYEVQEVGDERLTSTATGEVKCIARQ